MLCLNLGYFLGMVWLIVVQITANDDGDQVNFITYESHGMLDDVSEFRWTLIAFYFAITSLSTVGFGDFTPRSDIERIIGAFMLLGGVLIFSNCMNNFIEFIA